MPRRAKIILIKKEKVRGLTFSDFKTIWYWPKYRYIDQWNRIESPEINPYIYGQFIFDIGSNTVQWGIVFSADGLGQLDTHMQKNEVGPLPTSYIKINSRWIKDFKN